MFFVAIIVREMIRKREKKNKSSTKNRLNLRYRLVIFFMSHYMNLVGARAFNDELNSIFRYFVYLQYHDQLVGRHKDWHPQPMQLIKWKLLHIFSFCCSYPIVLFEIEKHADCFFGSNHLTIICIRCELSRLHLAKIFIVYNETKTKNQNKE